MLSGFEKILVSEGEVDAHMFADSVFESIGPGASTDGNDADLEKLNSDFEEDFANNESVAICRDVWRR